MTFMKALAHTSTLSPVADTEKVVGGTFLRHLVSICRRLFKHRHCHLPIDWQRDKSNIRVTSQVSSSVKIECAGGEGALDCVYSEVRSECTVCFCSN